MKKILLPLALLFFPFKPGRLAAVAAPSKP